MTKLLEMRDSSLNRDESSSTVWFNGVSPSTSERIASGEFETASSDDSDCTVSCSSSFASLSPKMTNTPSISSVIGELCKSLQGIYRSPQIHVLYTYPNGTNQRINDKTRELKTFQELLFQRLFVIALCLKRYDVPQNHISVHELHIQVICRHFVDILAQILVYGG